jgi:phenylacetate-CoA ligase
MTSAGRAAREHYDALETRSPDEREAALARALPAQIALAMARAPAIAARLGGVDPSRVTSRSALAALPVLRKSDVLAGQNAPDAIDTFGGFATVGWGASRPSTERALRVFVSPGPIREPETARPDYWRMARGLFAAGFRAGDLVHNSFSYHLTPAGSMMETGAHAIGCTVFPGGTGQTELQLQAMATLAPTAYTGTPSFLRVLLERADESRVALPSLVRASLGGEAMPAALSDWLGQRGIAAFQTYGTADLGLVAYETSAPPEIARARLVVDGAMAKDRMTLHAETSAAAERLGERIAQTIRDVTKLRGEVALVAAGSLPSDGKQIEDRRSLR